MNKNLKNKKQCHFKTKGYFKENIVAQYLKKQGGVIVFQNKKILNVEIDILVKKNNTHFLIEVKSLQKDDDLEKILKPKQKNRLKLVAQSLSEDFANLQLLLATVDRQNRINFFEIL